MSTRDMMDKSKISLHLRIGFNIILGLWITIYTVLLLKNPGVKSQDASISYIEDTLYVYVK